MRGGGRWGGKGGGWGGGGGLGDFQQSKPQWCIQLVSLTRFYLIYLLESVLYNVFLAITGAIREMCKEKVYQEFKSKN